LAIAGVPGCAVVDPPSESAALIDRFHKFIQTDRLNVTVHWKRISLCVNDEPVRRPDIGAGLVETTLDAGRGAALDLYRVARPRTAGQLQQQIDFGPA
jgi:hypothetical protein